MFDVYEHELIVSQNDIDLVGHVNNVVYIQWMQDAALAHSAALGWSAERYQQRGQGWVARLHQIEYLLPAYPNDRVVVQTWVADMRKVTSTRKYRIVRFDPDPDPSISSGAKTESLLAIAHTNWAYIDFSTRALKRIPPEIASAYRVMHDQKLES